MALRLLGPFFPLQLHHLHHLSPRSPSTSTRKGFLLRYSRRIRPSNNLILVDWPAMASSSSGGWRTAHRGSSSSSTTPAGGILDIQSLPSSLSEIEHFLRAADEVEAASPRVAYLCRVHAYKKSNAIDPSSSGSGVRQFKTDLEEIIERDNDSTLMRRVKESDWQEVATFYLQYYYTYISSLKDGADDKSRGVQLTRAYRTANALYLVLDAISISKGIEVDQAVLETHNQVEQNKNIYIPYNILPLHPGSSSHPIMRFPEVQAASCALCNTNNLPWSNGNNRKPGDDLLSFLQEVFGFQKDNVANQREHIILLLADAHIRQVPRPHQLDKLDDRALDTVMDKLFKNYKKWCKYHGRENFIWLPAIQNNVQQHKILFTGLYLLIWGEAANLRFMPECLSYIYNNMAYELHATLHHHVTMTGEYFKPVYGGEEEAFLNNVITPIYHVIEKEAEKAKTMPSKHSRWRNYDDLNEYFWSSECFQLGWPMESVAEFFKTSNDVPPHLVNGADMSAEKEKWTGKINFVETRSVWQIFRSFNRLWSFLILYFQAMLIIAWNGDTPFHIVEADGLKTVSSIFITHAILNMLQGSTNVQICTAQPIYWKKNARWCIVLFQVYDVLGLAFNHKRNPELLHAALKIGDMIALWAPIIPVYFMDIQVLYALFSAFVGYIHGSWLGLGEIRTIEMLRERFERLPYAFNECLVSSEANKKSQAAFSCKAEYTKEEERIASRFSQIWNLIITSLREEDLISNREKDLLLAPYYRDRDMRIIQWPLFLLANKMPLALDMAAGSRGNDRDIKRAMKSDEYFSSAIKEFYGSLKKIMSALVIGPQEIGVIQMIFKVVDDHIARDTLIKELNMSNLTTLYKKVAELLDLLDIFEVVTRDMMNGQFTGLEESLHGDQLFKNAIDFPVKESPAWIEQIKRMCGMLTVNESAIDVPANPDAQRRLIFFAKSLFMVIPAAPQVRHMMAFSILTPYYKEDVLFSSEALEREKEDGISILFYLQQIYPDEWKNFLERMYCKNEQELNAIDQSKEKVRLWASYRGQTLTRTARGMSYLRLALVFQNFLDMTSDNDLLGGIRASDLLYDESPLLTRCRALADMKFTHVISCQVYGSQKRSCDPVAQDVMKLMRMYPSIRVAFIDEVEEPCTKKKVYYSTLVKSATINLANPGHELDETIYRIKLPGNAILGEGKPENQNHAIIFTRGEAIQTIDMNQEHYFEEALKMRNLLQEFLKKRDGGRYPSILGLREHIFTGSVSSLAWFMSNQETSFVTIGQRVLANPLRIRMHYGHPDVFDRLFHLTRGGVSKASKIINLSEDVYAGYNTTLRGGHVTFHEYMQVGKGRDVGMNQIALFEAKVANGNSEQTLSRDTYRLGNYLDFFRMLSYYHTSIGFYFSSLLMVWNIYVFLITRLYFVVSGVDESTSSGKWVTNKTLQTALASQNLVQFGFLMAIQMIAEVALEKGFKTVVSGLLQMLFQLAPVFYTFLLGTKAHYYEKALFYGGAEYKSTGRGFSIYHTRFSENYRLYARSHFLKAMELAFLLVIYAIAGKSYSGVIDYISTTIFTWLLVLSWIIAPFLFNPSAFEWHKVVEDWKEWRIWLRYSGGIGVRPERSWEAWWEEELRPIRHSGKRGILLKMILQLRFFVYQYCLSCRLNLTTPRNGVLVYGLSWTIIIVIMLTTKIASLGRRKFRMMSEFVYRLIKWLTLMTVIAIMIIIRATHHMTLGDAIVCMLAAVQAGWGLVGIGGAIKPAVVKIHMWGLLKSISRSYDSMVGLLLFIPIVFFAWIPFVSEIQTRILFNPALSRGLQVSRILDAKKRED
ncbi:hypothetical protein EJB05_45462 [Eragrostis curvula]|uniref:1,3-beta-glucan synthase n=1 Tax=Eragrostis curvula TaxID=38414 RepID=A0A5J9TKA8_9POAL|nr:hypothetical protein EJB05_45462 [Eragrostis curvula]